MIGNADDVKQIVQTLEVVERIVLSSSDTVINVTVQELRLISTDISLAVNISMSAMQPMHPSLTSLVAITFPNIESNAIALTHRKR